VRDALLVPVRKDASGMVSAIGVVLESEGDHVFSLSVELEYLPLPHVGLSPFKGDAGKVSQHFVGLDAREMLFYELVAFALLPFADVRRFLYVLTVDSV
jgi:hypothetical protein